MLLKTIKRLFNRNRRQPGGSGPVVIPRAEHQISRANISGNALKVLYRLKDGGFEAYLVGGGVRDMLLGREPKDFDVVTDARPEEIKRLFRNCILIGRRFRLAHVRFGQETIEVATFRGDAAIPGQEDWQLDNGRILRDNVYGTLETDAWRRDFTANALYYNIRDFSVVDYTGGAKDLRAGNLRLIGDPQRRYQEDPVRMLRAVRFTARLGFRMDQATEKPLYKLGALLQDVPAARLFDEVLKLFLRGYGLQSFELLRHYDLFRYLFPRTDAALAWEEHNFPITFVAQALANTDRRVTEGKPVTPAFLYAALLWEPVRLRAGGLMDEGWAEMQALQSAASEVIAEQVQATALPKRFSLPMREIWHLQPRFRRRTGKRALKLLEHERFRAAFDFLNLRAEAGEEVAELRDWWAEIQNLGPAEREKRVAAQGRGGGTRRGGRKRRRRRQVVNQQAG